MVFSSHVFLFYFLPLVLLLYYNFPYKWRNLLLTILSYLFYGWWKPWFISLMLVSTIVDYICGCIITAPAASRRRRIGAVVASCCVNLGLLGFFKYYMFSAESLNYLLGLVGADTFRILRVTLPIGISFYTFQTMSYTIDVYRGDAPPVKSFFDFSCFVALFPQLIAGPIIRYRTIAHQLAYREYLPSRFASGVTLFILGFAKKILLANPVGAIADAAFAAAAPGAIDAWFGVTAYALQIYFDFCGYSDMAVGLGRMLGFEFPKNFNAPYLADSMTDVWRRWHISLSTFLRDYLYIPLGGNRKGETHTYVNLAVVMLLGGLWHGARWNFVLWGAYHGLLLGLERWLGKKSVYARLPRPVRIAVTFVLMLMSWVLFRVENLTAAIPYYSSMFGIGASDGGTPLLAADLYTPYHLLMLAVCMVLVIQPIQAFDWAEQPLTWPRTAVLVPLFTLAVIFMFTQAFNPFLYFQF